MLNNTLYLILAGLAVVAAYFAYDAWAQGGSTGTVQRPAMTATEAHSLSQTGEIVLVDIRTPEEWRETGVPIGAHAINMYEDPKVFTARLLQAAAGDRTRRIALICRTGNRSSALQGHLVRAGFTNVIDVSEGVAGGRNGKGWLKHGLPTRPGSTASIPPKVPARASMQ